MPRHPFRHVWADSYLGQDHRGRALDPANYPAGNVTPAGEVRPVSVKQENRRRLRAAWAKCGQPQPRPGRAVAEQTELGEFMIVTDRMVEQIRAEDLARAGEFLAEEEN